MSETYKQSLIRLKRRGLLTEAMILTAVSRERITEDEAAEVRAAE